MTTFQKVIKYAAMALAILLAVSIVSGIVGVLGNLSFLFGDRDAVGELQTFAVGETVTALDIEIGAAALTVKAGDAFAVESNLKDLKVTTENGKLSVTEPSKPFGATYTDAVLNITLPAGVTFDTATVTTGAGKVTVDTLAADTLRMTFGAGEVHIGSLTATKAADMEGGAGKITVDTGTLANLDLDMGVGALSLTALLTGDSELDCGVGETRLTLLGDKASYAVSLDKGIGNATVDGTALSSGATYGNGPAAVDIDGGVGSIYVTFE